jgi:FMN phosphatase YigB (HAD superfamily)
VSIPYLSKAIDSPSIEVVSVDFFDTLVWRKFQKPIDLFFKLGKQLINQGYLKSPRTASSFALLRIEAEKLARQEQLQSHGLSEVTLHQIYLAFPPKTFKAPLENIVEIELSLERESLIADFNLVESLKAVCNSKLLVICSDTYFSEKHLQSFIESSGIPTDLFGKVFVSSEWGISKSEGLLAKVVLTCGILPEQLLHIGDHPYKDGHSADRVGALYIPYPEIGTYGEYSEKRFHQMASVCSKTKPFLESDGGVWGLSRRFTTAISGYPLNSLEPELVAYTYGAMFCGFADWIGREVTEFSPDIIFCPTREGLFLSQFLNKNFQLLGIEAEAKNFLTSRAALLKGSFFKASFKEIEKFCLGRRLPITIRRFASIFNLQVEEFGMSEGYLDYPLRRDCKVSQEILASVSSNTDFRSALLQSSAEARNRILAYFKQMVSTQLKHPAGESFRILVADVGWSGTSQKILESILRTRYPLLEIRGRYLMLDNGALGNALSGIDLEGWLTSLGESADFGNVIMPVKELLEQLLMADMPSVVDYTESGNPIFAKEVGSTPILQKLQIKRLQELIQNFLEHYVKFRQDSSGNKPGIYLGDCEELFRTNLAAQAYSPESKELEFFSRWEHEDNNNAFVNEKIVDSFQKTIFQYATLREIYRTPSYWHLGNIQKNQSDRLFLQQFIGNYGIDDVYEEVKIPYKAVALSGDVLAQQEAKVEITSERTGILVVHCFSEGVVRLLYRNATGYKIQVDKVLIEYYDTKNYKIDALILEGNHSCLKEINSEVSTPTSRFWLPGSELELSLLDLLEVGSYDITLIFCIRLF